MKRQIFTLIGILFTVTLFAQDPTSKIVLSKGQKIQVSTTVTIESTAMGMDATNNSTTENLLEVKDATDKNYTVSNTLTKVKISMNAPGNTTSFDSEKKEDLESETGKSIAEKLNKPVDILIDNTSGAALTSLKPKLKKDDAPEANPMAGLFALLGENSSDDIVVTGAFQLIPKGKKPGDSWSDSNIEKELKVRRTYTFKSNADTGAVVQLKTMIESTGAMEMMGMSMEMNTNTETTSDILLDIATGLVRKKSTEANVTGSMQLMGQAIPINAKATTVSTYN